MMFVVALSLVVGLTSVPGTAPNQPLTIAGGTSEIELALYATTGAVAAVGYLMLVGRTRWRFLWLVPAVYLTKIVIDAGSRGVLIGTAVGRLTIGIRSGARSRVK